MSFRDRRQITFPVLTFFGFQTLPSGRQHVGHLVVDPAVQGRGETPELARRRLLDVIRKRVKADPALVAAWAHTGSVDEGTVTLRLPRGRATVDVTTPVIWQERGPWVEVWLPRTPSLSFLLPAGTPVDERVPTLERVVAAWRQRREGQGLSPDAEPEGQRGDRVEVLDVTAVVPWQAPFGGGGDLLRVLMAAGEESGRDALESVATNLLEDDDLREDLVPWDGAAALHERLFVDPSPPPLVLVGPAGSGRTTRVHAAVRRERALAAKRPAGSSRAVWHLDPGRVIAGQSMVGQWERRFQGILEVLRRPHDHSPQPDVLFVDLPLALLSVGKSAGGALTLASMLRPMLERRAFPCVLEATPEVWQRMEERDPELCGMFEVMRVTPPAETELLEMAVAHAARLAETHGIHNASQQLHRLVELHRTHPSGIGEPAGLIGRVDRLFADVESDFLPANAAIRAISASSGLRPEIVDREKRLVDAELTAAISARLIGQPDAVAAIAAVVHTLHAGLARAGRPVASMLLVGPTGVGKTEAARVLTDLLFASPGHLLRVDMNEHVDAYAIHRLLGTEREEGLLTGPIRHRPDAVLLLDEIEKAHPRVLDLLLQLLDEGRLTDGAGRVVSFSRAIVILTSNVGADEVSRSVGFDREAAASGAAFRAAVVRAFRPEFINRIDRILPFRPLQPAHVRAIAARLVASVQAREGFLRRTLFLDVSPDALDLLAARGHDPAMGARALKREIERALVAPVAASFASFPPDAPVQMTVGTSDAGVLVEATALRWAAPVPGLAAPESPDPDEVRALWELLEEGQAVAEASPQGVRIVGADRVEARERLRPLYDALTPEDRAPLQVSTLDMVRLRRRAWRDHWYRGDQLNWAVASSYRSLKAWLLDTLAAPSQVDEATMSAALAFGAARAVALGDPDECEVTITAVGSSSASDAALAAGAWVRAVQRAVETAGGTATIHTRSAKGNLTAWTGAPTRAWTLRVAGPGIPRLVAGEAGLHAVWGVEGNPVDEVPRLFRVAVAGDARDELVRTVVHEASPGVIRLHDPRVSGTARLRPGDPVPLSWWWTLQEARR